MKWLDKTTFVCLDCEFTGLDLENDRVLEIACVRFTLDKIIDSFEVLLNPQHPISEEALKIHHISEEMVKDKPTIDQALPDLLTFLGNDFIVGHAVQFDLQMLEKEAERLSVKFPQKNHKLFDTLRLARAYGDSPNNSLSELAKHFNIEVEGAHRAMNDVMMNIEVFKFLIQRFKSVEQIQKLLANPIKMKFMPLGKYKGQLFSEIPLPYLQWAANMQFDKDLLFTIRLELKKRKQGGCFSQSNNPFANL
ncbi:MAG: 3'-5' exonuclease DinG [Chlamydiales bacterium]|nr:3'-5' exonuclease DinG [Chlamydiales bacterium]MCH9619742.1 3'-5' exonuclease DinG [Chlamydiales bacterium]MCH9623348.1 3'-5' exonuclease DinG [Chlamydiales bacterium]